MKKFLATLFAAGLFITATASAASATDPCETSCESTFEYTKEETAWGKGGNFDGANWAMYTPHDCACGAYVVAGNPKKNPNYVGWISFGNVSADNTITLVVDLNEAKAAFDDPLTVHIGYYDEPPTGKNPPPGQLQINIEKLTAGVDYRYYEHWQRLEIYNVPAALYYAVHAEVVVA